MAVVSIALPAPLYSVWQMPKFITGDLSRVLIMNLLVMTIGIIVTSAGAARGGSTELIFSPSQQRYLTKAYRILFTIAVLGYVVWAASAVAQGVGPSTLLAVVQRDEGAISALKASARPIGGVTTVTQFGPVVIALGAVLHRLGLAKRRYWILVVLALVRTVFYAERLALIEVLVPLLIVWALTAAGSRRKVTFARIAPIVAIPLLWIVFAASEYSRSWIYYQSLTDLPFPQWVTLRLFGYYTTSFDNSALLSQTVGSVSHIPYFSIQGVWSAPILSSLVSHPLMAGLSPDDWWAMTLKNNANPDFNNQGSFLVTNAEFGLVGSLVFWLVIGLIVGAVFARMTRGSVVSLVAVAALFVGILELSRFIYWTQGRAFPIFIALIVMAFTYPRTTVPDVLRTPLDAQTHLKRKLK
jgi:hypothetical protein